MSTIPFWKMQGSGNDFILLDNRAGIVPQDQRAAFARRWCPRASAVGADGVIFLENDSELDFAWGFFNADGSEAEMCGNGARCMAVFAHHHGAGGRKMVFRTLAGAVQASIVEGGARVRLTDSSIPEAISAPDWPAPGGVVYFLNTGVPHVVAPVNDLEAVDIRKDGAFIRFHPRFQPAGTNANFIARTEDANVIAIRTYERGVEDETLACGTGSVAAAIVAARELEVPTPIEVFTRSGIRLRVDFRLGDEGVTDVFLEGPAEVVYRGELEWIAESD